MKVLILSDPQDPHCKPVHTYLAKSGVEVIYWRFNYILNLSPLQASWSQDGFNSRLNVAGNLIDLNELQSIWLRRPGLVQSPPMPEDWLRSFIEWETSTAVDGILRALPVSWVNHPRLDMEASLKVWQLEAARRCGLSIPDTLISNNPEEVLKFHDEHEGCVIYKLIDQRSGKFFPANETVAGLPTMPLREPDLQYLQQVSSCLHLFQERIEKLCDLRVTVVGSQIFPVCIASQEGSSGKLDWRLDYNARMETYKLPESVEEAIHKLMKLMGLSYGAIDLCIDTDGRFIFFEINPSGQYLWLEEKLDLPISESLARLLSQT